MARNRTNKRSWLAKSSDEPVVSGDDKVVSFQPKVGLVDGVTDEGQATLKLVFLKENKGEPLLPFDLTDLLIEFPNLVRPIFHAFYLQNITNTYGTAETNFGNFKTLWDFIRSATNKYSTTMPISEVDTEFANAYVAYLNTVYENKGTKKAAQGNPLGSNTKRKYYAALKGVIEFLLYDDRYEADINQDWYPPINPWPHAQKGGTNIKVLPFDEFIGLDLGCTKKMTQIMAVFEEGNRLIAENIQNIPENSQSLLSYEELGICLAAISKNHGGYITNLKKLHLLDPHLADAIQYIHKAGTLTPYLYPTMKELIPFLCSLTIRTGFNPDTAKGQKLSDITQNSLLSDSYDIAERIKMKADKGRAIRPQKKSFAQDPSDITNPHTIIENVKKLTARLRPQAGRLSDHLWLYRGHDVGTLLEARFPAPLAAFIKDNKLPIFTLDQIHPTYGAIVYMTTNGNLKDQQTALGHASAQTTYRYYMGTVGETLSNEKLAAAQGTYVRYAESKGKSDIRGIGQASKTAATPGFECIDPYDSPIEGQEKGKLCSAYLGCPGCQMSSINKHNGLDLAYLIALEDKIKKSASSFHPHRYLNFYQPILEKLGRWIPTFSSEAWDVARNTTNIKKLPELE